MSINRNHLTPIAFITLWIVIFAGLIWLATHKSILEYDDSLSLLFSSAHAADVAQIWADETDPYMTITTASEWKQFIEPHDGFAIAQVADDITYYDRHTPFYFQILHVWMQLFGTSNTSTIALNILLQGLVAIALYRFSRLFFDVPYAMLVVSIWLLSPISIQTALWTRQYVLLPLVLLLFIHSVYVHFYAPSERPHSVWAYFSVFITCALLIATHYYAAFILSICGFLVLARWFRHDFRRVMILAVIQFAALGAALLIYPHYFRPLLQENSYAAGGLPLLAALEQVLIFSLSAIIDAPYHRGNYYFLRYVLVFGLVVVPIVLYGIQRWRRASLKPNAIGAHDFLFVFMIFLWNYVATAALNVAGITHMSYRYLNHITVIAALLPVFILHLPLLRRVKVLAASTIVAAMMLSGYLTFDLLADFYADLASPQKNVQPNELVIVNLGADSDSFRQVISVGHVFQIVYRMDDDSPILVGFVDDLTDPSNDWIDQLSDYEQVAFLGFADAALYDAVRDAGYTLQPFDSYMYYAANTQRIENP